MSGGKGKGECVEGRGKVSGGKGRGEWWGGSAAGAGASEEAWIEGMSGGGNGEEGRHVCSYVGKKLCKRGKGARPTPVPTARPCASLIVGYS